MKSFMNRTADLIRLIFGLAVFGLWMSVVGNPHVVETTMGLVIAGVTWFVIRRAIKNMTTAQ
jgi:hypothetical protein